MVEVSAELEASAASVASAALEVSAAQAVSVELEALAAQAASAEWFVSTEHIRLHCKLA